MNFIPTFAFQRCKYLFFLLISTRITDIETLLLTLLDKLEQIRLPSLSFKDRKLYF